MRPKFLDSPHSHTRTPRHSQGWRDLHGEKLHDDLDAAKGIFTSAVLGAVLWMAIGGFIYWIIEEAIK